MAKKFIPSGDNDFAVMSRNFASTLVKNPQAYRCTADEANEVADAVRLFRDALAAHMHPSRSCKATRMSKDSAREKAARLIRDMANRIRIDRTIDPVAKVNINVKDRPALLRRRKCPQTPPELQLVRGKASDFGVEGRHVLRFFDRNSMQISMRKPEGAVRVELFAADIQYGDPILSTPSAFYSGLKGYIRSYSRSPIEVHYPKVTQGACRVYWARWADATGETGPFSKALVVRLESWSAEIAALPAPETPDPVEQRVTVTSARRELPDCVETFQTMTAERGKRLPSPQSEAADAA